MDDIYILCASSFYKVQSLFNSSLLLSLGFLFFLTFEGGGDGRLIALVTKNKFLFLFRAPSWLALQGPKQPCLQAGPAG